MKTNRVFLLVKVMDKLVKKLGIEKKLNLINDFNLINDKYRQIANAMGYQGELKFQSNGGYTTIFVVIE